MLESKWGLRFIAYYWQSFSIYQLIMYLEIFLSNDNLSQNSSKTIEDVPVEIIYNSKEIYM